MLVTRNFNTYKVSIGQAIVGAGGGGSQDANCIPHASCRSLVQGLRMEQKHYFKDKA